ncbi:HAD-IIIC family phosphatase [Gemmatimonas sp.]|uniref:HAD-IIIC family phosphatase n=1 Tax=Gemmatimonas sp. TaxID=1962908 RepID=UPI0025C459E5|nr:HAD-IIIC family phosphatase [Gemmatimonas sp.]MCA2993194.1 HAD-IIIC family phosphatase [Gemmatimonas sp.]
MPDHAPGEAASLRHGPPFTDASAYHRLARELKVRGGTRPLRVALLASFTFGFIEPFLRVELGRLGLDVDLFIGGYGEVESLWLDESSALHAFQPDVVVVAVRLEDMSPDAAIRVADATGATLRSSFDALVQRLSALLQARAGDGAGTAGRWTTLVANFAPVAASPFGVGDASVAASRQEAVAYANHSLREAVSAVGGAYVWDYAGLVAAHGAGVWRDDRLWFLGRIPVAATHHPAAAQHLARTIRAAVQPSAKVLVLDLDNTLWGGVVGDDGVEALKVGDDYPGNVFKAVQRHARGLRDRGVLLAIASKNDEEVVRDAFARHPEFLLRWDDFAAHAVSWEPKSAGLARMAEQLGLGLDALVFLDDNPVERAEVQSMLPAVRVIDVEPWGSLPRALAAAPWFDQLAASAEDLRRASQYAEERQRQTVAGAYATVEEYLGSLELTAQAMATSALERQRVAQLIAKTNQFNLTLRRPSEAQVTEWMSTPDTHRVLHMRLADRFGDHGIIAAAVLARHGETARIEVLVMSCRVMNRRAEHAFLSFAAEVARQWGCTRLLGEYVPGPRNSVVADLYPALGFEPEPAMPTTDTMCFGVALTDTALPWPAAIRRTA